MSTHRIYVHMRVIQIVQFLVSGRALACQQEILLVLAKTPPIHY